MGMEAMPPPVRRRAGGRVGLRRYLARGAFSGYIFRRVNAQPSPSAQRTSDEDDEAELQALLGGWPTATSRRWASFYDLHPFAASTA